MDRTVCPGARAQGAEQIAQFLDRLALNERLSASSQRQALNALVFLYREVFGQELCDFSEYRRAKVRIHLPVWVSRVEVQRLFGCLDHEMRLMAQVMYGSGLIAPVSVAAADRAVRAFTRGDKGLAASGIENG